MEDYSFIEIACGVLILLASLAFGGGVIFVVVHFIVKFW